MSDDANDTTARDAGDEDLERLRQIRAAAPYGSVQINGKSATAVQFEKLDDERVRLAYKMGRRTVAKVTADADALPRVIGEENAERVRQAEGKGTLRDEDLRYHRGQGEEGPARAPKKARQKAESEAGTDAAERNVVEPDESAARDAVARAARHRAAEREQRETREQEGAPVATKEPAAPSAPTTTQENEQDAGETERARRAKVLEEVRGQFRVVGDRYRFKDGAQGIAFTDRGEKLATSTNDARAARAVAALADAKGWESIKVSGHGDFRREVWLEARARGLEVRGYTPTEQDRQEAEERAKDREPNAADRVATAPEKDVDAPRLEKATDTPAQAQERPARTDRNAPVAGTLVEHGPAPYQHDPDENPSYRVKVATDVGEREVWGKDLERGITEARAAPGDAVELARAGKEPVSVDAVRRDDQGRAVGTERIETTRNAWDVRVTERRQVLEAVQDAFAEGHAGSAAGREALRAGLRRSLDERERAGELPAVPMYDHRAPSRANERARGHDTEQTTERSR